MLTLYDYYRSSACFRVRIALNLKGLDHRLETIHLLNNGGEQNSPQYQKINPQALVPTLQDGHKTISQSIAIIEYLNDLYPDPPLLPNDAYQKARVRAFALSIAADIHPINNLRVLNYLTYEFHINDEQKTAWIQHWIMKGLNALETQLTQTRISGNFCFGHTPTLADICLIPQLYNARRFACDLSSIPTLVNINAHCQRLEAFSKAWPHEPVT